MMKIICVTDYEEMSEKAGMLLAEKVRLHPEMTLGLATGSTPKGLYEFLVKDHIENGTSYRTIKTVNLDEYVGMPAADSHSYHYFMRTNFFNQIDVDAVNTHIPNGVAENLEAECSRYDQLITELGGVDLQILGIGQNGHIGFNEPGSSFSSRTHVVKLDQNTRAANSRFFKSLDDVPTDAITIGIASILDSKEIFLLASGAEKAEAIFLLLTGEVSEAFPASALKRHTNVTIIADREAMKLFDRTGGAV